MLHPVGVTYIFCCSDSDGVLNSTTGQPVMQGFYNASGSVARICVIVVLVLVMFFLPCTGPGATASVLADMVVRKRRR